MAAAAIIGLRKTHGARCRIALMEYTKLGRTGLDVSRICLGCMSYGGGNRGNHAWSLGEEESRPFIKAVRPEMRPAERIDQLGGDAHPPSAADHEGPHRFDGW